MSKNDITGDSLVSKSSTKKYDEGFDRIWGKKIVPNGDIYMIRESEVSKQIDEIIESGSGELE